MFSIDVVKSARNSQARISPEKYLLLMKTRCTKSGKQNRNSHICRVQPNKINFAKRFAYFEPCSEKPNRNEMTLFVFGFAILVLFVVVFLGATMYRCRCAVKAAQWRRGTRSTTQAVATVVRTAFRRRGVILLVSRQGDRHRCRPGFLHRAPILNRRR